MSQHPNLPALIPGEHARDIRVERGGHGAYYAHLLGQAGARRGLKAGRPVISQAHSAYQGVEWSGSADRRLTQGILIGELA